MSVRLAYFIDHSSAKNSFHVKCEKLNCNNLDKFIYDWRRVRCSVLNTFLSSVIAASSRLSTNRINTLFAEMHFPLEMTRIFSVFISITATQDKRTKKLKLDIKSTLRRFIASP